jgi:hypothetical protein
MGWRCGLEGRDEDCIKELIGETFRVFVLHAERNVDNTLRWFRTKIEDFSNAHI